MNKTKSLTLSALFIALGLILPFITAQVPVINSQLCPMHFPVLLAGFVLGSKYGLIVGLVTPLLRSVTFGMPPMMPTAVCMAFELATYGFVSGWLYEKSKKNLRDIYLSLIVAMLAGRLVWGLASLIIYGLMGNSFVMKMFISGAFVNAAAGIVLQLIIIPVLVSYLKKAKVI